jgi:hypothetical protein
MHAGGGGMVGATKFAPFPLTVKVKEAPPGLAVPGLMLAISGVTALTGLITKVAEFWLRPPPGAGFDAVMVAIPGEATSDAKTDMAT